MYVINEEGRLEKMNLPNEVILDWIETYYPGFENLTEEEQAERDNYESLHEFQFEIAKRRQEDSFELDDGEGCGGSI